MLIPVATNSLAPATDHRCKTVNKMGEENTTLTHTIRDRELSDFQETLRIPVKKCSGDNRRDILEKFIK